MTYYLCYLNIETTGYIRQYIDDNHISTSLFDHISNAAESCIAGSKQLIEEVNRIRPLTIDGRQAPERLSLALISNDETITIDEKTFNRLKLLNRNVTVGFDGQTHQFGCTYKSTITELIIRKL